MKDIKNHVELPLIEPMYSTYHFQGACTAIISNNMSIRNWFINNSIQLKCNKHCLEGKSPTIVVENTSYNDVDDENYYIVRMTLETIGTIVYDLIHKFLSQGFYVAFEGIDDYYMKGKSLYNKHHFPHDGLIYGYDLEKQTYDIYAYDESWVYSTFKVSREDFELGRKSSIDNGWAGQICAIRANNNIVDIDISLIINGIKKYIASDGYDNTKHTSGFVYGVDVYEYIAQYLQTISTSSFPFDRIDNRIFRMIWEHNKAMLERVRILEKHFNLHETFSKEYESLVSLSDNMRMQYGISIMRQRISTITPLVHNLRMLKNSEVDILTRMLESCTCNTL